MPFFALRAGQTSSRRPLVNILKEAHQDLVEAARKDRQTREDAGAPVDDDALREPAPWVDRPELGGVEVAFRAVSHEAYLEAVLRVSEAFRGMQVDGHDLKALVGNSAALQAAMADFVARAVVSVSGLEDEAGPYTLGGDKGLTLNDIETLKGCGLLGDIYAAAKRFQELSASEKKVCGLRQQPTFQNSNAINAQPSGAPCEGVTVVHLGGQGQNISTTPAQDDILYVTGGSQPQSRYTILREKAELGWAD